MLRTVLIIDDSPEERSRVQSMLVEIEGLKVLVAEDSAAAADILTTTPVDCVITDILRRIGSRLAVNEGYSFVNEFIRPRWPQKPVIFHTKNLPWTFEVDGASQYLSKWESCSKKEAELEWRVCDSVRLHEAFCDHNRWLAIQPRLTEVNTNFLTHMTSIDDVWRMSPGAFEQLVAEILQKSGFEVLWVPGGSDGGLDIVAGCPDSKVLIDVKRYQDRPVGVELVRSIYGVAEAARPFAQGALRAGIITSSHFTKGALDFRAAASPRLWLRDRSWLESRLASYAPRWRGTAVG